MLMRIQISLTDSEGHTEMHPIDIEAEMPEMGDRIIDDVEQAVLALNQEAIRAAVVGYLEELSKKKARDAAGPDGGTHLINDAHEMVRGNPIIHPRRYERPSRNLHDR